MAYELARTNRYVNCQVRNEDNYKSHLLTWKLREFSSQLDQGAIMSPIIEVIGPGCNEIMDMWQVILNVEARKNYDIIRNPTGTTVRISGTLVNYSVDEQPEVHDMSVRICHIRPYENPVYLTTKVPFELDEMPFRFEPFAIDVDGCSIGDMVIFTVRMVYRQDFQYRRQMALPWKDVVWELVDDVSVSVDESSDSVDDGEPEVEHVDGDADSANSSDSIGDSMGSSMELREKLQEFYQLDQLTNIVLCAGSDGKKVGAHEVVLAAVSEVFRKLFLDDKLLAEIKVDDVDIGTLKIVVDFCYGLPVDRMLKTNAKNVLPVAKKYKLLVLEKACLNALKSTISEENRLEYYTLGGKIGSEQLLKIVSDFVGKPSTGERKNKR